MCKFLLAFQLIYLFPEEPDYSRNFYFFDALMILVMLIALFLKVNLTKEVVDIAIDKKTENDLKKLHKKEIKQLFTPSTLIYFGLVTANGLSWGIKDTYSSIYLVDEMKATYQMIGYSATISMISSLFILPFTNWIVEKIGDMHVIFITILVQLGQLLLMVLIK